MNRKGKAIPIRGGSKLSACANTLQKRGLSKRRRQRGKVSREGGFFCFESFVKSEVL